MGGHLAEVIATLPATDPEYGQWWSQPAGEHLYDELGTRIGAPITAAVNQTYGAGRDALEAVNTAVLMLRRPQLRSYIVAATDPWAYLASSVKRETIREIGAYFRTEWDDRFAGPSHAAVPATPVHVAVENTAHLVASYGGLSTHVAEAAVWWFAERGHSRLSHLFTRATKAQELHALGLNRRQILAIANLVMGPRPKHLTSLLGAYLVSDDFNPTSSPAHRKALQKFANRMAAAES